MTFLLNPKPKFVRPEILCDPPLPIGLHRVNPRSIKGKKWWDIVREEAYAKNNYCCWVCGVHISEALFYYRLEAHERFEYRYGLRAGKAYFKEVAALCHACHNFIHIGRLKLLMDKKVVSREKFETIYNHGLRILIENKLMAKQKKHPRRAMHYKWPGWILIFESKEYRSPFKSFEQYVDFFSRIDYSKEEE